MKKMLCIYTQTPFETCYVKRNAPFCIFLFNFILLSILTNSTAASSSVATRTIGALNGSCITCLYLLLALKEKKKQFSLLSAAAVPGQNSFLGAHL